ncbi:hypothetical protein AB0939_06235 [Streptomyces sp. NPDC006990]|uniref:hypothetical protein n=1 Tax=Streptomyces sp. NPDC006990 TaxID=3154481 RepID=UPI0034545B42
MTPDQFALFWGYFAGATTGAEPAFVFHRWAGRVVLGCPTDDGLYQVQVGVDPARLRTFRAGLPGSLLEYARAAEPVAAALAGARPVGRPRGTTGTADSLFELVDHRAKPSDLLTGPRLLGAVGRLLARGRVGVLREVARLAADDRRRRALTRRPRYGTG